ncbi:ribbon-helix-helix domain-containing protein [Bartonella sp. 220]|uniref:ribbon-helix-helix domain-containing protein n=1 Tax=Bartonella sp. 220B TaxID=2967260 RepID=UPI0022A94B25|nr:ribbon-helix-helix domain-containing protein [Bartonella sp. 220B]MCZ2158305.1 ribbon-helix-helix domain-containing protein [Bartonella sp. 220B]
MHEDNSIDWSKVGLRKISVRINGHATSVSLEQPFLDILKTIAHKKGQSLAFIITDIDRKRPQQVNLSASLRLYALQSVLTQRL